MPDTPPIGPSASSLSGAWPLGFLSGEIAQQFLQHSQMAASTLVDLNAEIVDFAGKRMIQTTETINRIAQCRSLPEVFDVEVKWLQSALEDYSQEAGRMMELAICILPALGAAPSPSGASGSPSDQAELRRPMAAE